MRASHDDPRSTAATQVTAEGVTIRAPHRAGLFYGIQSLLQLLPASEAERAATLDSGNRISVPAILVGARFWESYLLI